MVVRRAPGARRDPVHKAEVLSCYLQVSVFRWLLLDFGLGQLGSTAQARFRHLDLAELLPLTEEELCSVLHWARFFILQCFLDIFNCSCTSLRRLCQLLPNLVLLSDGLNGQSDDRGRFLVAGWALGPEKIVAQLQFISLGLQEAISFGFSSFRIFGIGTCFADRESSRRPLAQLRVDRQPPLHDPDIVVFNLFVAVDLHFLHMRFVVFSLGQELQLNRLLLLFVELNLVLGPLVGEVRIELVYLVV